jgi:hypothetical protein
MIWNAHSLTIVAVLMALDVANVKAPVGAR